MLGILAMVLNVIALICFIMVLIKQFQNGGVLHGIIGIITCGIWTLIWGWMNASRLNIKNIMMIWTLVLIVCIVVSYLSGAFNYSFGTPASP
jgi:hypothetical protein